MTEYGVKALAAYSGINAHTLRIWERRYGVAEPARSANGRRVYSQADAERFCLIAELTTHGHAISAVAKLALPELEKMVALSFSRRGTLRTANAITMSEGGNAKVTAMLLDRMVAALEAFQLRDLSSQLALARLHCSVSDFIYQIVLPLIGRIGTLVGEEVLSIAHEHALSAILKTHIYQAIYHLGSTRVGAPPISDHESSNKSGPQIIITTQEGDHHEFGILLASLIAESRGLATLFFGCNMPAKSLAGAANALRSPIILIGRTIKTPVSNSNGAVISQKEYLKELDQSLVVSTEIWIGGVIEQAALKFRARHKITHVPSLQDLDKRFVALMAKNYVTSEGGE